MKRSTPLRADPEKLRAWQDRSRKPLKRTAMKRAKAPARRPLDKPTQTGSRGFSSKVRRQVRQRSGGLCEAGVRSICTRWASEMHHRKLRANGDHSLANALHVCKACHDYIGEHPKWAYRLGLMVRSGHDPASVPVTYGATLVAAGTLPVDRKEDDG